MASHGACLGSGEGERDRLRFAIIASTYPDICNRLLNTSWAAQRDGRGCKVSVYRVSVRLDARQACRRLESYDAGVAMGGRVPSTGED